MTAAVAGRAAASGGGRAAAGGAAARPRAATRSGNRPRPNIDEREAAAAERTRQRGDRAAGDFRKRYQMDGGQRAEKRPAGEARQKEETPSPRSAVNVSLPGPVSSGAGFILGVLFWSWIALPFLKNGPEGVRNMLRAKFTNKAPDGSYLP